MPNPTISDALDDYYLYAGTDPDKLFQVNLVKLGLASGDFHFTDYNHDLTYDGNTYTASTLKMIWPNVEHGISSVSCQLHFQVEEIPTADLDMEESSEARGTAEIQIGLLTTGQSSRAVNGELIRPLKCEIEEYARNEKNLIFYLLLNQALQGRFPNQIYDRFLFPFLPS